MIRPLLMITCLILVTAEPSIAEQTSENNDRLRQGLEQFPAADADGDGVLTMSEARDFLAKREKQRQQSKSDKKTGPDPTLTDVKYGPYDRNLLDFWKADSDKPTPLVVFIHGGGFVAGSKEKARGNAVIKRCLDRGISFASINYRYRYPDGAAALNDPQRASIDRILRDAARAIQFMRYKAEEWNIDKPRIACYGGSAGAGTSLWLAVHDDLADPASDDPVLRESTRIVAAGMRAGQFTYDIMRWPAAIGFDDPEQFHGPNYQFYGVTSREQAMNGKGAAIRADVDMEAMITPDDPPIFASSSLPDTPPTNRGQANHHPRHAMAVREKCDLVGVTCITHLSKVDPKPTEPVDDVMLRLFFKELGVE